MIAVHYIPKIKLTSVGCVGARGHFAYRNISLETTAVLHESVKNQTTPLRLVILFWAEWKQRK